MIPDKYIELVHRELDGVNSSRESVQLRAYLNTNAEAQKLYDELWAMSALLKEVKPVEPPAHLPHAIINALPPRRVQKRDLAPGFWEWLSSKLSFKYAYAFSGGLVVGAALFALFLQGALKNPPESSKLYGTIGAPHAEESSSIVKRVEINRPEVAGALLLKPGSPVIVEINLASQETIELSLTFEKPLECRGFSVLNEAVLGEVSITAGAIKLLHAGQKSYVIFFAPRDDTANSLDLKITRGDEILYATRTNF